MGASIAVMCSWYLIDSQSCLQHENLCGGITNVTLGAVSATLVVLYLSLLGPALGITLIRRAKKGTELAKGGFIFGALLLVPCSIADMVFNIMGVFFHDHGAIAFAEKTSLTLGFNLVFDVAYLAMGIALAVWSFRKHSKKER
jgi:hypothetical protein